jgi:hypothetical protein
VCALDFFQNRTGPPNSGVIVHELAHQWTGGYLVVAAWQHIWLNEGFASYTEWLWSEHEGGATAQEIFDAVTSIPAEDDFWSLTIGDPGPGCAELVGEGRPRLAGAVAGPDCEDLGIARSTAAPRPGQRAEWVLPVRSAADRLSPATTSWLLLT